MTRWALVWWGVSWGGQAGAADCSTWQGVSLPLEGGSIVRCHKKKVSIDHGQDAKPLRWDYVEAFRAAGWTRGEPDQANPQVHRDSRTVKFTAEDTTVVLELVQAAPAPAPAP